QAARGREGLQDPPDGERDFDPEVSLSRRRESRDPRRAVAGSVGLQFRHHDAHAGNAHLSAAPEDREGPLARRAAGNGDGRLQAGPLISGLRTAYSPARRLDWISPYESQFPPGGVSLSWRLFMSVDAIVALLER